MSHGALIAPLPVPTYSLTCVTAVLQLRVILRLYYLKEIWVLCCDRYAMEGEKGWLCKFTWYFYLKTSLFHILENLSRCFLHIQRWRAYMIFANDEDCVFTVSWIVCISVWRGDDCLFISFRSTATRETHPPKDNAKPFLVEKNCQNWLLLAIILYNVWLNVWWTALIVLSSCY